MDHELQKQLNVFEELAKNNMFYNLTNGRNLDHMYPEQRDRHQKKVLSGHEKIIKLLHRAAITNVLKIRGVE